MIQTAIDINFINKIIDLKIKSEMEVKDIPNRGLGVVTTRALQAGETIITDTPILLYPQSSAVKEVCNFCLRWLAAPGKAGLVRR